MPFQVDENDLSFINQVERSWEEFKRPEWRTYTPRSSAGLLEQVLKRLKQRDVQSYFLSVLQEHWLRLS